MDTHISPDAPVIDGTALRCVRLPGEPDVEAAATLKPPRSEERLSRDPGAESPVASGTLHADGQVPGSRAPPSKGSRHGLLAGGAAVALVAAGAGAFVLSPFNHVVPVPSHVRAAVRTLELRAGWAKPPLVAPAASLAGEKLPPQPAAVVQPAFHPLPAPVQLAQVLQFGPHPPSMNGGASAGPTPAVRQPAGRMAGGPQSQSPATIAPVAPRLASGLPPSGYVPHEPGTVPVTLTGPSAGPITGGPRPGGAAPATPAQAVPPSHPTTVASVTLHAAPSIAATAAAQPPGTQPVLSQPAHLPVAPYAAPPLASRTRDATVVAAELQAAPLATAQQVQVLEVVNEIAAMVRGERTELADLQAQIGTLSRGTKTKLLDFERRLAMLEAQTGIAAAAVAGRPPPPPAAAPPSVPPARPAGVPTAAGASSAASTASAGGSSATRVRYRLQAASPGLALLAEIDKGGGAGAQLQVSVGDTIPGYGRVISVAQQGTAWVVTTEHGSIR